jgi:hypothetical protein
MKAFIAFDDTDNLESIGTGHLLEFVAQDVEKNGWGARSFITRHQLLVHPDVPYTSHNSSMCFSADLGEGCLEALIAHASAFLEREGAPGSDPGLCVAVAERLAGIEDLVAFGRKAKEVVVTKSDAYGLAQRLGVHLSEHGGTGQGVVGALAAVGLRMGGNDGRVRGHLELEGDGNGAARVGQIRARSHVRSVRSLDGVVLPDDELVLLRGKQKAVLLDGMPVLLVMPAPRASAGAPWQTCGKDVLKAALKSF